MIVTSNRIFEIGDVVIVKETSLQVTEDTIGYIYYLSTSIRRGHNFCKEKIKYIHIITEEGHDITIPEKELKCLVFLAKSKYIYNYKHPRYIGRENKILQEWIDVGSFSRIINTYGYRDIEVDTNINSKWDPSFWKIID